MEFAGEYYLTGVMETGCGIKINADNSFEFFYSYGALDRHGYGTWKKISDTEIALNTDYGTQTPFTISHEETREWEGIKMGFPNYNKILLKETTIHVTGDQGEEEQVVGKQDLFHFNTNKAIEIIVTCLFYFDNPAKLKPADPSHNYFELTPNQNLPLVHFNDVRFTVDADSLTGSLRIIDENKKFRFVK